uniref:Met4p n=1 Tax=Saccharomyces cariocanus TaxID=114526 RepID=A0A1L4AA89_9SACH|nr:Met4p [Saccharomyces cariocanus]
MKQEQSREGDSYSTEFINLFGKETATHASNNGVNNNGMGSASTLDQFVATASSSSSVVASSENRRPLGGDVSSRGNTNLYDHAVTPEILLEQLAYVDNFIPSLDNEFSNVDWNVNTTHNNANHNGTDAFSNINANPFDLDEQLAIELSAFADDSFIFPDEDKPSNNNNNNNNGNNDNNGHDVLHEDTSDSNRQRNPHFLTQRRNTFLTSQYDQSKSRFSSRNKRNGNNGETNSFDNDGQNSRNFEPNFIENPPQFPVDTVDMTSIDHGAFTNVDITSTENNAHDDNGVDTLSHLVHRTAHTPNRSSPLSNIVSAQNPSLQQRKQSDGKVDSINDNNSSNKAPNITVPDYSIIPTSVLVTLLPRVNVPKGAYDSLTTAGFDNDQIDAIAAIMAYHHQKKIRENNNNNNNTVNANANQEAPILKNINELLSVLIPSSSTDTAAPSALSTSPSSFNEHGIITEASFLSSILELGIKHPKSNNIHNQRQSSRNNHKISREENGSNVNDNANNNNAVIKSSTTRGEEIAKIRSEPTLNAASSAHKENSLKRSHSGDLKDTKVPMDRKYSDNEDDEYDDADLHGHGKKQLVKKELVDDDEDLFVQSKKSHQKKKLKEKELESSIHELTEIAASLQKRIHTLETENKLLKNLVLSSGETEGIKKAESLKKQIFEKVQKE